MRSAGLECERVRIVVTEPNSKCMEVYSQSVDCIGVDPYIH